MTIPGHSGISEELMTQIPDAINFIQTEETAAYSPDSQSTLFKVGGSMNYLLNRYPMPPSMVIDWFGLEASIPAGFIVCDGRTVSRTTYADLFAKAGTLAGVGDGLTTFNVPDLRGLFTRMVDQTTVGSAGRDPDAATRTPSGTGTAQQAGSYEADEFGSHRHTSVNRNDGSSGEGYQAVFDAGTLRYTSYEGGNETRPKNYYMLKLIKT